MSTMVSIIIPNWNGIAFLNKCIAAILQSCKESGYNFEILLMDDASTDDSGFKASREFPDATFYRYDVNLGFGHMVNEGARLATGDILVLVNNDLIARPDFVRNLCRPFETKPQLFGVGGKTVDWDNGDPNHVNMRGLLENGTLKLTWSDDQETTETMFVQGGSCAVRRRTFLELGGLCPLFAPAYWEDYDLSYKALKAGYQNIYVPAAVGSHLGQGSMIRAYGRDRVEYLKARNKYLLLALNLTDDDLIREFWASMPDYVRAGSDARFKHRAALIWELFSKRRAIQAERQFRKPHQKVTDKEIFDRFRGMGTLC